MTLTVERLREVLRYDPQTGLFWWVKPTSARASIRVPAGNINLAGYRAISIDRKLYRAHRLAWLYMTGEWPEELDHVDMNRDNNSWSNLREATRAQNSMNTRARATSKSGIKGVSPYRGRWRSRIMVGGQEIRLGVFDNPADAHAAYLRKAQQLAGEFARGA